MAGLGRGLASRALYGAGLAALASLSLLAGGGAAVAGCGPEPGEVCNLTGGSYHIVLPEVAEAAQPGPAVLFLHGYGGSGAGSLANQVMVKVLTARGYAVIAPDALPRRGGPRSWTFFPGWQGRDEIAFLQEVAADAAGRFDLDRDTMILAGFSAGGFMVNYLACAAPTAFAGYAPIAGGFWRPQPADCAGEIRLFHSHGWMDSVVPLEGRYLNGGQFQQGDIFAGLELWRDTNGCDDHAPDQRWQAGDVLRRRWDCGAGADIELLLFPGGHQVPSWWSDQLLDWFEALPPKAG